MMLLVSPIGEDEPMATLGERLRREREAKGISLEDIAGQTRIGVRMLKAIEEDHFDQLPGGIYNKAFLRQYASFLGLNTEETVREYDMARGVALETPALEQNVLPEPPATPPPSFVLPWKLAALALIPIVALTLWLAFRTPDVAEPALSQTNTTPQTSPQERAVTSRASPVAPGMPSESSPSPAPSAAPSSAPEPPAASRETTISATTSPPVPSPIPTLPENPLPVITAEGPTFSDTGDDELLLKISARSEVWLYITVDGDEIWQGILQPNETRQVQAAESIRLTVGNAGGVELMLNGKPLGALGRQGEVKRVSIAGNVLPSITP